VLFVVYFALPALIGIRISAYVAAVAGFIAFIAAYIAEDCRSGLASVPSGLVAAGLASGLLPRQVLVAIVLPIAVRRMIPALFGQFVRLRKIDRLGDRRHRAERRRAHRQCPRVPPARDRDLSRACLFRAVLSALARRALARATLCGGGLTA